MKWVPFTVTGRHPPERRCVLVQFEAADTSTMGLPPMVVVGYLRYAAGDKLSPYFVCPGVVQTYVPADRNAEVTILGTRARQATHWCDCLGDDFEAPLWPAKDMNRQNLRLNAGSMRASDVVEPIYDCCTGHPGNPNCNCACHKAYGLTKARKP